MTLREEIIKYSGEEVLDEAFIESVGPWLINVGMTIKSFLAGLSPVEAAELGGALAIMGTPFISVATMAIIALKNRKNKKFFEKLSKITNEEDRREIEEIANSDKSDRVKKQLIIKVLSKYAVRKKEEKQQQRQQQKQQKWTEVANAVKG